MAKKELTEEEIQKLLDDTPEFAELGIYRNLPIGYEPKVSSKEMAKFSDLIDKKKYQEAICKGEQLLVQYPDEGIVQEELVRAYFKGRNQIPDYRAKCITYAKEALSNRVFNDGLLKRLFLELGRGKCYYQILKLWTFLDSNKEQIAKVVGLIKYEYYQGKACKAKKHIALGNAIDTQEDKLFTPEQEEKILSSFAL